jgi:putative methionine-R-sulfoxide reductase with GAF domain
MSDLLYSFKNEPDIQVEINADIKTCGIEKCLKKCCKGEDISSFSQKLLSHFASEHEISQGIFFVVNNGKKKSVLRFISGYACDSVETMDEIEIGEGFPGQVAKDGKLMNIGDVPEDYISIVSGLGKASPASIIIFPISYNNKVLAVIELSSFHKFTKKDENYFMMISPLIGEYLIVSELIG